MALRFPLFCFLFVLTTVTAGAVAQDVAHSDVFFSYGEERIEITPQGGRLVFPQTMPQRGFFAQYNNSPGFASERDLGGGTAPNDMIGFNVLDRLMYWNEGEFWPPKPDTFIRISNNPSTVANTVIGPSTEEQPAGFDPRKNSIGESSSSGDFHSHVEFLLEPLADVPEDGPSFGAYGIKMNLASSNETVEDSVPFFIVFRFGIDEDLFVQALDDFNDLLSQEQGIVGDFNADGFLTAADVDLLSLAIASGSNGPSFDLTDDQLVSPQDRTKWVEELAETFFGDADLDGAVQFSDFLALSSAFGQAGGWAQGDFDGDGQIQFSDFLTLSSNFGMGSNTAASVPEPGLGVMVMALVFGIGLRGGHRTWAARRAQHART